MSGSRTIIGEGERLDNVHPGDILRDDFLIGGDIALDEVASAAGIDDAQLAAILTGDRAIDAETDLRLARYFGMSEGFFLGLQDDFDLEEVRRSKGPELDRIVRRAA